MARTGERDSAWLPGTGPGVKRTIMRTIMGTIMRTLGQCPDRRCRRAQAEDAFGGQGLARQGPGG